MAHKLENPKRVEELNPKNTLIRIGVSENSAFCDIGAGTGLFADAAVQITANRVYAVEISAEMREVLCSKDHASNFVVEDSIERVPSNSCDVALMCTVLHELDDVPGMMREVQRTLKRGGALAVIEFHKAPTPMGPPVARRISELEAAKVMLENGFMQTDRFELGENFYCLVFNQMQEA